MPMGYTATLQDTSRGGSGVNTPPFLGDTIKRPVPPKTTRQKNVIIHDMYEREKQLTVGGAKDAVQGMMTRRRFVGLGLAAGICCGADGAPATPRP